MQRVRVFLVTMIVSSLISIGGALADHGGCPSDDSRECLLPVASLPGSSRALLIELSQSRIFGMAGSPEKPGEIQTSVQLGRDVPPTAAGKDPAEGPFHPGFRNFHRVLAYNFTRGLISQGNLVPLAIGSAGALTAYPFDEEVSDAMWGSAPAWGNIGHDIGGLPAVFGSTGVILAVTPFVKSERFKGFSFTLAQAMILNSALTISLKAAISRTRPNGDDDNSFPSGHASYAFTWSTVAAKTYGWKMGVPVYAVATFIALSRVEKGAHYLSDVIAGSTVGFISGITAVRGSKHAVNEKKWTLMPSFGRDHTAVCFSLYF